MKTQLKAGKRCPIPEHKGSRICCGRGQTLERAPIMRSKWSYVGPGIRKYPDGRIERTPAALTRHKEKLLRRGDTCVGCDEPFNDYREVELSHRKSKGFNGGKRDDSDANLCLAHKALNRDCGSMDLDLYLRTKYSEEVCKGV